MTDRLLHYQPPSDWQPPTPEQEALADALWLPIVPPSTPTPEIDGETLLRLIEGRNRQWDANPQWRRRLRRAGWRVRYYWLRFTRWVSIATGHAERVYRYRMLVAKKDAEQWIREEDHL
jgi:hypothetical protein